MRNGREGGVSRLEPGAVAAEMRPARRGEEPRGCRLPRCGVQWRFVDATAVQ
jgi:hypothetical protein